MVHPGGNKRRGGRKRASRGIWPPLHDGGRTTDTAQGENPEAEDATPDRKRGRPCGRGDDAPKRFREVGEDGQERPTDMDWSSLEWSPVAAGLVARLLSPGDPEACSDAARAAESKEMGNMLEKGTFSPEQVCDWDEVR